MRKLLLAGLLCLSCAGPKMTVKRVEEVLGEPCTTKKLGKVSLTIYCLGPDKRVPECRPDPDDCLGGLLVVVYEGGEQVAYSVVPRTPPKVDGETL